MKAAQGISQPDAELQARFAAIVGERHALTAPDAVAPYVTEERGLYQGHSPLVLRPGNVDEVAAICRLAHDTRTALVPQGGNTGLVGAQTPHAGEIVLSLRRLDHVREIDVAANVMTCEAGVVLANAQAKAAEHDRLFPLSLAAEGSATIGGNLSSNAGGTAALAYGVARDLALGLEVVLADGRVLNALSKLKKDNTGYDLKDLFIGAEGTLGIITAATLRLFPRPRSMETAFVAIPSPARALALLHAAQDRLGDSLTTFELMARRAMDFSVRHGGGRDPFGSPHPWYVLMEISHTALASETAMEALLGDAAEAGLIDDAVVAASLDQRRAFWRLREFMSESQKYEGGSIKHDISVPVSAVPDFLAAADAAAETLVPGCRPCAFGHLGDGNIHYNVSQPVGADKAAFLARWQAMNDAVHTVVLRLGGSVSAEHGIGILKRETLAKVKDPVALDLMRALKRTLDPHGILNPGKMLVL